MCEVIIKNPKNEIDFIIYNHIASKKNKFTILQIVNELKKYNLNLTYDFVQSKINEYVKLGLLKQHFKCYSFCG